MSLAMLSVSVTQALVLWDQLHAAMNGTNSFGSDVAEIYVHTLMGHSPSFAQSPKSQFSKEPAVQACTALYHFCKMFEEQHDVVITFAEGEPLDELLDVEEPATWRVHLRVTHKTETAQ